MGGVGGKGRLLQAAMRVEEFYRILGMGGIASQAKLGSFGEDAGHNPDLQPGPLMRALFCSTFSFVGGGD